MSDPQSNIRIAESLITFVTYPEIPSSTDFSQPGNYLKELIYPTWAERLGFTPARGTHKTSKKKNPHILFSD